MPDTPEGPPVPASGGIGAQLKQLLPMLPALLASAKGNPDAMGAFMEGYQRSMAQLQQREHAQTQMGMQQSEMQSRQARQAEQDRIAAEDRQRRMAMERVTIGHTLAEAGGGAENPESASALIDSLYSQLQGLGTPEELAPMRDYAQHAASANISNRKKGEFRRWVSEDLPKSQFMQEIQAAGADADVTDALAAKAPRMLEIARQMRPGQERFKASELWTIAEALQPAPAAPRQRPVAAVGSFEDYIQRKYGDAPTPEQITEGRRVYQQSDDRPRVDVNVNNGLNANQSALLTERLAKSWTDANSSGREMRRQLNLMETGLKRFRQGDKNGGSQAVLVTFQKILDPTSVVRESEYARSAEGISLLGRIEGYADKLARGGAGVPDDELAAMVETARQMLAGMDGYAKTQRSRIDAMSQEYGIKPELIFGLEAPAGGGGGVVIVAPDGSRHEFATQAQADAFKKLAGIR